MAKDGNDVKMLRAQVELLTSQVDLVTSRLNELEMDAKCDRSNTTDSKKWVYTTRGGVKGVLVNQIFYSALSLLVPIVEQQSRIRRKIKDRHQESDCIAHAVIKSLGHNITVKSHLKLQKACTNYNLYSAVTVYNVLQSSKK